MAIKKFEEFLNESLSSTDKKDLDKAWEIVMKRIEEDSFFRKQKKSDLTRFINGWNGDHLFDWLCDELEEFGWTEDDQAKAGASLYAHWKEKAEEELAKL